MNLLRNRWHRDAAFRIVAIAAAVGTVGIEVPGAAWAHGGGAFFVPFLLIAWLVARPLIACEFGLGLCYQGSLPEVLRKLDRRWEWLGWWGVCIGGVVALVHAALAAWLLMYAWDALIALVSGQPLPWGASLEAAQAFARQATQETPLEDAAAAAAAVHPVGAALLGLALLWLGLHALIARGIVRFGITLGVAWPLAVALVAIAGSVVIGQPGAIDGIARMLSPRWMALAEPATWTAAGSLVLRGAAIGSGVHVALASFLNRNADGTGSASLVLFTSLCATVVVAVVLAAAIGVQAAAGGVPIEVVPNAGPDAVFATAAAAFAGAGIPAWMQAAGAFCLFAGLSGLALAATAAMAVGCVTAIVDRSDLSWREASARVAVAGFLAGLSSASSQGLHARDALVVCLLPAGLALVAAGTALVMAWAIGLDGLQRHLSAYSVTRTGTWWRAQVAILAPAALVALSVDAALRLTRGETGMPMWSVLGLGLAPCLAALAFALSLHWLATRKLPA